MGHHNKIFHLKQDAGITFPFQFSIEENRIRFIDMYFTRYNWDTPEHVHQANEGVLFIEGKGEYACFPDQFHYPKKKKLCRYVPGTILNVSPGNVHAYNIQHDVLLIYWNWEIHFSDNNMDIPALVFSHQDGEKLITLATQIFDIAVAHNQHAQDYLLKLHIQLFLVHAFNSLFAKHIFSLKNETNKKNAFYYYSPDLPKQIQTFICNNFHLDLSLDMLSAYFHKSPRQIKRLLKQLDPPVCLSKELNRLRINTACQLLELHPKMRLSEIALRCGYKNEYYFGKVFKQTIGMSPGKYRAIPNRLLSTTIR